MTCMLNKNCEEFYKSCNWSNHHITLPPPASSGVEPAKEVCPCRAEGQAAHAETLRACSQSRSQEGCTDPTSGNLPHTHIVQSPLTVPLM